MRHFRRLLKRLIRSSGFELQRVTPKTNPACQLLAGLQHFGIDTVLDIGANTGQFGAELREAGYRGRLVSFEPLSRAWEALNARARRDVDWSVHERGAIGDFDGEIEINVAANSVSSSVLPILEAHTGAAPGSAYVASEKVPMRCLDSVAGQYLVPGSRYLIKIDTQGFESQVLDGGSSTLAGAQGLLCELSLLPLYEGQQLWLDMIRRIEGEGFILWALQKGFTDARSGRTLQVNAIFFREPPSDEEDSAS